VNVLTAPIAFSREEDCLSSQLNTPQNFWAVRCAPGPFFRRCAIRLNRAAICSPNWAFLATGHQENFYEFRRAQTEHRLRGMFRHLS
jgi:hypothetical protein